MKKALIISLSPNVGHLSHVIAYYQLYEEMGYQSTIYTVDQLKPFLPSEVRVVTKLQRSKDFSLVFIYSPCSRNIIELLRFKLQRKTKVIFVCHEPISDFSELRRSGYSQPQIFMERIKNAVGAFISNMSNGVFLSSKRAVTEFEKSRLYKNKNHFYIPLIFDDERKSILKTEERKFFSYIGTIASDHSFDEYVSFVRWAIKSNWEPQVSFMIATKNEIELDIQSSRLTIIKGKPMTNEEINKYYSESFAIWNAYERTMQSGVLAKSFMFGTPAILMRKNISEYADHKKEVYAIDDNHDVNEIANALLEIRNNLDSYSQSCRKRFEEVSYYKKYISIVESYISAL